MGLQYTQHTKAFPTLSFMSEGKTESVKEELHLSSEELNGGISLYWYWFSQFGDDKWAIQWEFFTDSVELAQRAEVQDLLEWLRHCSEMKATPHWSAVIPYLDNLGFTPSSYHTQHDKEA